MERVVFAQRVKVVQSVRIPYKPPKTRGRVLSSIPNGGMGKLDWSHALNSFCQDHLPCFPLVSQLCSISNTCYLCYKYIVTYAIANCCSLFHQQYVLFMLQIVTYAVTNCCFLFHQQCLLFMLQIVTYAVTNCCSLFHQQYLLFMLQIVTYALTNCCFGIH